MINVAQQLTILDFIGSNYSFNYELLNDMKAKLFVFNITI